MRVALAALLVVGCARGSADDEPLSRSAQRLEARTRDGWRIALLRYRPSGPPKGLPVLLCHGVSANARNLDLDEAHSLARWMAAHGREAFTMSLRGTGDSDHPDAAKGRTPSYSIDTLADEDLPAAIARVEELTSAPKVDFIGHSMGGILAYLYLARGGDQIHALVTLGSPARFAWGSALEGLMRRASALAPAMPDLVDVPALARAVPLAGAVDTPLDLLLYNPNNLRPATYRKLLREGLGTVSSGVVRQFARFLERDGLVSADGSIDYRPLLADKRVCALVIAGKLDRVAPAPAVKAGYDLLGAQKSFFVAGEENGLRFDYGHMDLILGERASEELWPRLVRFLDSCGSAAMQRRGDP